MIFHDEPGQDGEEDEKENGPDEDRVTLKELDIFIIITLYVHRDLPDIVLMQKVDGYPPTGLMAHYNGDVYYIRQTFIVNLFFGELCKTTTSSLDYSPAYRRQGFQR